MTLTDARAAVGQQMGIYPFDGSVSAYADLTAGQQMEMTGRVINYILANPGRFTGQQVETARRQAGQASTFKVEDTSFDYGLFWNEVENNAVDLASPVANLGKQISNSVNIVAYAIPVIVLGAVIYFSLPYLKNSLK